MSRTTHHRKQSETHAGYDYGGRYKCNKLYNNGYGIIARWRGKRERRAVAKAEILKAEHEIAE